MHKYTFYVGISDYMSRKYGNMFGAAVLVIGSMISAAAYHNLEWYCHGLLAPMPRILLLSLSFFRMLILGRFFSGFAVG